MKYYRFLKITQDQETGLYCIDGILNEDWLATIPHTICDEIPAEQLYLYVGHDIADKAKLQDISIFDEAPMLVLNP